MQADARGKFEPRRHDDTYNALRAGEGSTVRDSHDANTITEDVIVDLLRSATSWTSKTLHSFAEELEVMSFKAHDAIFTVGDITNSFYVVVDGDVKLSLSTPAETKNSICTVPIARGFGWEALEGTATREYTATAHSATRVLRVPSTICKPIRASRWKSSFASQKEHGRRLELLRSLAHGEQYVHLLASTSIFSGYSRSELRFLAILAEPEHFNVDEGIAEHGKNDGMMHVLESGRARRTLAMWDGALIKGVFEHELRPLTRGAVVSCRAALDPHWRSVATTLAETECRAIALNNTHMEFFLKQYPSRLAALEASSHAAAHAVIRQSHIPLFRGRKNLSHSGQFWDETYEPRASVFKIGEVGDHFYVVVSGTAEILGSDGDTKVTLGPGEYFGEMAFMQQDGKRRYTARAGSAEPLYVKVTGRAGFARLFSSEPTALAEIEIRVLADKVPVESLLNHPEGLQAFSEHMMKEYAYENVEFYMSSRKYSLLFTVMDAKHGEADEKVVEDDMMHELAAAGVLELTHKSLSYIQTTIRSMEDISSNVAVKDVNDGSGAEADDVPSDGAVSSKATNDNANLYGQKAWNVINPDDALTYDETARILIMYMRRHLACYLHGEFIAENSPKQVKVINFDV